MKIRTFAFLFFFLLLAANVAQIVHYGPMLPDKVASHFDFQGTPNGWSSNVAFNILYGVVLLVMTAVFVGLPVLLVKLPSAIINMPNRDYWLAPERKKETCAVVSSYLIWVGIAVMALLLTVFHWIIRFNLGYDKQMGSATWVLGSFFLFILIWVAAFYLRFRKPAK